MKHESFKILSCYDGIICPSNKSTRVGLFFLREVSFRVFVHVQRGLCALGLDSSSQFGSCLLSAAAVGHR